MVSQIGMGWRPGVTKCHQTHAEAHPDRAVDELEEQLLGRRMDQVRMTTTRPRPRSTRTATSRRQGPDNPSRGRSGPKRAGDRGEVVAGRSNARRELSAEAAAPHLLQVIHRQMPRRDHYACMSVTGEHPCELACLRDLNKSASGRLRHTGGVGVARAGEAHAAARSVGVDGSAV
jgi:hypothetical protein